MSKRTRVIFRTNRVEKKLFDKLKKEQTKRFIEYAQNELLEMITTREFHSRTFNLADSYVWVVYYDGKAQRHGYAGPKMATKESYLHEWSKTNRVPVNGRKEAQDFVKAFGASIGGFEGWTIVWAAVAPYSIYLDPAARSTKTNRFLVISQRYDHIKGELEPKCKVEFRTSY